MSELLYEGKTKKVFKTNRPGEYLVYYKDDITAFDNQKQDIISGKGIINNKFTNYFMNLLESYGIYTHYIKEVSDRETLVAALKIIPLEVIVRNISSGSFCKRYGMMEGVVLPKPTIEFSYKKDELGDPLINDSHIVSMNILDEFNIKKIKKISLDVNKILKKHFAEKDIKLVDFKLEFGKNEEDMIILGDEISPDTMRLWDKSTNKRLDKDVFRKDEGDVAHTYNEIFKRIIEADYLE